MREIKIQVSEEYDDFDYLYERLLAMLGRELVNDWFSIEEVDQ